ncbi:MAG: UDP-N-acetylmuramoyl-tripeptide--D-alanyl-D-alanine ligase [Polaribacter sp.]|nr:UDP-N-acetylmuramoyl-tripeptide--D-alanyl-D-alanine ligase [Polaribacter sp.]MDG1811609.1 UDP-N-acetylmuramoyl-tripeptide--D-alanyl-D-alanine ligase [Polaribacter sp.]MDG1993910.1 UDP-N-acetylmuramoyl-tripeptide--D-alanyl-D-alanine ligase [Polaribacter sp.]
MNIKSLYKHYIKHYLVDTDSRKIRKNTIYFALKGPRFNGNKFAEEAIAKGAMLSVVDEEKYATHAQIVLVDNVLETLQELAKFHRTQLNIPILALTGSNGKTTTKELIHAVLQTQFKTTATSGNLNNHIGVPLTVLSMLPETEIGIVEMGANHHKEIAFLCSIAQPDFGYITNFGKAHLEGFGSLEGVIEAKSELYTHLKESQKAVFVNLDDAVQVEKSKGIATVIPLDATIDLISANPTVLVKFKDTLIQTHLIGTYNFSNIAAAITVGTHFGVSSQNIQTALAHYEATNNRSQVIHTNSNTIILDAYNANPTSMKAALENFSTLEVAYKVVILGDMFELGEKSNEEHQYISALCEELGFKEVYLIGQLFAQTKTHFAKFSTVAQLQAHLKTHKIQNKHVFIKGSRGMALEALLETID